MMWMVFISVVSLFTVVKACSEYDLSKSLSQSFFWQSGMPRYINTKNEMCDLLPNKMHAFKALVHGTKVRFNVLSFGDSYELGFCTARPSGNNGSVFSFAKRISFKNIYAECTFRNESISYNVRRMYGQKGDRTGDACWEHASNSSVAIITQMRGHRTTNNLFADSQLTRPALVNAVVHGSFLWDLKHAHSDWCSAQRRRRTQSATSPAQFTSEDFNSKILEAVCNHVQSRRASTVNARGKAAQPLSLNAVNTEQILQSWERLTMPWCDTAMLRQWQETFLREVHALLDAFPDSALFLRTQPISSAVFLGNFRCHKPMNDFIAHVARSFQQREEDAADASVDYGSEVVTDKKKGRVVRLIDLYSLFATPNDNGVDHFSSDNIHLTVEGFKVYRAYILRVLADYFEYN